MTRLWVVLATVALSLALQVSPAAGQDDVPDQCRTIIGCADAGPAPENPGDRGGYAQLLTLVVLAGGVTFIMIKLTRAAKAQQSDTTPG